MGIHELRNKAEKVKTVNGISWSGNNKTPNSVLLSFALHLIVLCFFAFTFQIRQPVKNTAISFLGALLMPQDVQGSLEQGAPAQLQHIMPLTSRRISRSRINPVSITAVTKPIASKSPESRKFQKMFFESPLSHDNKTQTLLTGEDDSFAAPQLKAQEIYLSGSKHEKNF